MKTDSQLQQDVMAELQWEPMLCATEIGVSAKMGVITLTGTVDCYAKKQEAEDAAKKVAGVKVVIEKIEVKYANSWASKDDGEIADEVVNSFNLNWEIPTEKVKVTVEKGWVTLEGQVEWDFQRIAAKKAVKNLMGVLGVSDNITITSEAANTSEKSDIERAIARNWSVADKKIGVKVANHLATLTGTVDSWYQKDEAGRLAANAPGVWKVENELVVEYS